MPGIARRFALVWLVGASIVGCGARSDLAFSSGGSESRASASSGSGTGGQGGAPATSSSGLGGTVVASSSSGSGGDVVTSSSSGQGGVAVSSSNVSVASSSSAGGAPPATGCSDGTREGFVDETQFPRIAGCSGGFSVPGVLEAVATSCSRRAGNSSANPNGDGCGAADLCAAGFHVCTGAADVKANAPAGCSGVTDRANLFFATRQGSTGCRICTLGDLADCTGCSCERGCSTNPSTANDLFGCGTLGDPPAECGVLDRFSNDACGSLGAPWQCGQSGSCNESNDVVKTGPARGGVLCCAD